MTGKQRGFVGRQSELTRLNAVLASLQSGEYDAGRAVAIRGRRRVGKTRLIREFVNRAKVPSIQFFATGASREYELARFRDALKESGINPLAGIGTPNTWSEAFEMLAAVLPKDKPSIVVIDEVPYLARSDAGFEGALQAAWDTMLLQLPVMLILIGSDMSAMQRMNSYGRPFFQRASDMEIKPLKINDVQTMTGLNARDAFDAYLVTGGLPQLLSDWPAGGSVNDYLPQALQNPSSGLITSGAAVLAAEFPPEAKAKQVLRAIGSGEVAFSKILRASGLDYGATLQGALGTLQERHIIVRVDPLSVAPNKKLPHYRIADTYLQFYSTFIDENVEAITGGFYLPALNRIKRDWSQWRGKAVEPIVRELLKAQWGKLLPEFDTIGSWWNRDSSIEVDVVLGDRAPTPKEILAVGSIKWRDNKRFDQHDADQLRQEAALVPGVTPATPMLAISRTPVTALGVTAISPEQLLEVAAS